MALNIVSTDAASIKTLGGMDITGKTIYTNTEDVTIDENTGVRSAAFEIDGGLVVRKKNINKIINSNTLIHDYVFSIYALRRQIFRSGNY